MTDFKSPLMLVLCAGLLCGPALAQADKTLRSVPVTIVSSKTLPVQVVSSGKAHGRCQQYDQGRYFQFSTIFNELANRIDTRLTAVDTGDSILVTRVVVRLVADSSGAASAVLSFNTAGIDVDPGVMIDPPNSGNLGLDFPPANQFLGGRFVSAVFEPDTLHNFSTVIGVRLVDGSGTNSVRIRQATVSVRGCLMRQPL